jgi:filamentous hemagglutinin family protein
MWCNRWAIALASLATVSLAPIAGQSQTIIPDGTTATTVNTTGLDTTITNGTAAGTNLFHSFQRFDIPTGGSTTFNLINTPAITTLFSRVTGGSTSNIDGAIRTINSTSPVSLFLMNPSGIIFGPNASLNIGGSFIGTTANSIKFADGAEFASTATPLPASLLTINVPIGLQMGQNPGAIQVNGTGHNLTNPSPVLPIANAGQSTTGLRVQPGNTLALVGGSVTLSGGLVSVPQGRLEVGGAADGMVRLDSISQGWALNYSAVGSFRDVLLQQRAALDASGNGSSSIQVQGDRITLLDGSRILLQNQGAQTSGDIDLYAATAVKLDGFSANGFIPSSIRNQSTSSGSSGAISITAPILQVQNAAGILSGTFGSGNSGDVNLNIAKSAEVLDYAYANNTVLVSSISSVSFRSGRAGNLNVNTEQLTLRNGGIMAASTRGTAPGGKFLVNAKSVDIIGIEPRFGQISALSATAQGSGTAGSIIVNTTRLNVLDGGRISTSTMGVGQAGSVLINAIDSVTVSGVPQNFPATPSQIVSAANIASPALQALLFLPSFPTGDSGGVTINTNRLTIADGGLVTVRNSGIGNAGTAKINANQILLDNRGAITASTQSGEGGNIFLQANGVILRRGSSILATAAGTGNGGNIRINAGVLAGFENSDIVANAVKGRGGNIQIATQGIFGLKFRPQLTPDNDITASSQFGINGNVQINTPGIDPNTGLIEFNVELVDSTQQIAMGCADKNDSSFIATGRGGVPINPVAEVRRDRTWSDTRDLSEFRKQDNLASLTPHTSRPTPLIEANAIHRNPDGTVELIATQSAQTPQWQTCASVANSP